MHARFTSLHSPHRSRTRLVGASALGVALALLAPPAIADEPVPIECPAGAVRSVGPPDRALFAAGASRDVHAEWCETYDARGRSRREGLYLERYASGARRTRAYYSDGVLEGPVEVDLEDGRRFLRGFLDDGRWSGAFVLFHGNGAVWLRARFADGRLDGVITTHHADGGLASETRFQKGREDGLARTFYPASLGAGLKSEVRVEADEFASPLRRFSASGEVLATREAAGAPPVAAAGSPTDAAPTERP